LRTLRRRQARLIRPTSDDVTSGNDPSTLLREILLLFTPVYPARARRH
jgi:hypothetical protein